MLAAKRLGAERIIALSRHADRQELAREFGATDIVAERGDEAVEAVMEMTDGVGVDAALECVGTGQAMTDRARRSRAPARWSASSASRTASSCRSAQMFFRNIGVPRRRRARRAPTSPSCSTTSSTGRIDPGRVLDYETDLDGIAEAYAAMDERRAIKSLVRVGTV